ncbi:hypothetical protein [Methanothrix soehngenii]|uniref:hypothetical protein n=1 Tax=Methanothrix soehngenii TaxID=2223 RepID=UPI00314327D3
MIFSHILPLPKATTPLAVKSRFVVCPEATNAARGGIPYPDLNGSIMCIPGESSSRQLP